MLENYDLITAEQLGDCAINVSQKRNEFAISKKCSKELKFASDCLKNGLR